LPQLSHELLDAYEAGNLDAFGLHVYGMVLNAIKVAPAGSPTPQTVLMESILQFPYNWSAWLDLAVVCLENNSNSEQVEHEIEEKLQPVFSGHFVYHFFCAHLLAERQQHAEALQIYEKWLEFFGGSPWLMEQHAGCSYHVREFAAAKSLLQDLHHHMPYRLDSMDVFSNILYVQEDAVALSQLAHTAVTVDPYRAETCCIIGNYYSLKQQRAKAVTYFQRALAMDRKFVSAYTLMGHEYIEWKQTAHALEPYRRAVSVAPGDYRAWYGLGQTYELLNMNFYALYYYKQAVQLRPYDARMWCALGTTYQHLKQTSSAIQAFERALQQDESEGVATNKLAQLYQKEGQTEKAAQCYMRHLEIVSILFEEEQRLVLWWLLSPFSFLCVVFLFTHSAIKCLKRASNNHLLDPKTWPRSCKEFFSNQLTQKLFCTWPNTTTARAGTILPVLFAPGCSIILVPNKPKPRPCCANSRPRLLVRQPVPPCTPVRKGPCKTRLCFRREI